MLEQANRTLAFFCPSCRQAVIVERSAFQLAAVNNEIACPCGNSAIQIEFLEDKVKLKVPCLFCEREHAFTCSPAAFLHERIMAFSCGASGLDCCYIGQDGAVYAAMQRLQETVDSLEAAAASSGMFLNSVVMEEILQELRDIARRGGISCLCGGKEVTMHVNYSSVELRCPGCGGAMKIPAATLSDIEDLCCKTKLFIQGKTL